MLDWRYEPPYDLYDPAGEDGYRHGVGSPAWFAALDADDGSLVGFLECRVAEREVEIGCATVELDAVAWGCVRT